MEQIDFSISSKALHTSLDFRLLRQDGKGGCAPNYISDDEESSQ